MFFAANSVFIPKNFLAILKLLETLVSTILTAVADRNIIENYLDQNCFSDGEGGVRNFNTITYCSCMSLSQACFK